MDDDALKARLIGATVLVLLAVLLIPELLSGRKAAVPAAAQDASTRGTRTFTIELAGSSGSSTVTEAPAAAASPVVEAPAASEPAGSPPGPAEAPAATPAAESPPPRPASEAGRVAQAADSPSTPPASAAAPPASEPDAAIAPAPVIPARGGWAVQVGAFGSEASARKLVDQLREAGYRAYVAPVSRGGKTLHRVRVGPEAARAEAESLVAGLKVRGLPATVVAND